MSDPVTPLGLGVRDTSPALEQRTVFQTLAPAVAALSARSASEGSAAMLSAEKTAVEFEAAMLTSFIEPMLPSKDSPIWGGTGASAWRGLFAQEVAAEIARAGGIGLADTVRPSLVEAAQTENTNLKSEENG